MSPIPAASLTYVVTGASRGLGLEFIKQLSDNSKNQVFALARNPAESKDLTKLNLRENVYLVKMDASSENSIRAASEEVAKHAPNGIDVLINNAGIGGTTERSLTITRKQYAEVFETNLYGVSDTTQAFLPLFRKRGQDKVKKIMNISSGIGSITVMKTYTGANLFGSAYGVSKTALNMLTRLNANELFPENFIVIAMSPGWVRTDMGSDAAMLAPEESISGMLDVVNNLTPEDNGEFFSYDGTKLPW